MSKKKLSHFGQNVSKYIFLGCKHCCSEF